MRKAVVAGLIVAALVMIGGQVISTLTYHYVLELARSNPSAIDVLSTRERFFIQFSNFWARYFIFLPVLIVPVSIGGAIAIAALFAKRKGGAG